VFEGVAVNPEIAAMDLFVVDDLDILMIQPVAPLVVRF